MAEPLSTRVARLEAEVQALRSRLDGESLRLKGLVVGEAENGLELAVEGGRPVLRLVVSGQVLISLTVPDDIASSLPGRLRPTVRVNRPGEEATTLTPGGLTARMGSRVTVVGFGWSRSGILIPRLIVGEEIPEPPAPPPPEPTTTKRKRRGIKPAD